MLNARITFGNIFSLDEPVTGVTPIKDETTTACVVDEICFNPPPSYRVIGIYNVVNCCVLYLVELSLFYYLIY